MVKYIIALILPFVSFFMRGKVLNGIICLAFPFVAMMTLGKYTMMPVYGPLLKILYYIVCLLPNAWAIYSVMKDEKKQLEAKTSELS